MATKARIPGNAKIEYSVDLVGSIVTVGTGGAAAAATTVPVTALPVALPSGTALWFGGLKVATLTASASAAATSLTVAPLSAALVAGDTANYRAWTKISEATTIGVPASEMAKLEASNLDSVGLQIENISGWEDPGDIAVEANWTGSADQTTLFTHYSARTTLAWSVTVPNRTATETNGFVWRWDGQLRRCANNNIDPKGIVKLMLTINCNSPTRTAAPPVA